MIYLYNLASIHNGLVMSTDNQTEYQLAEWLKLFYYTDGDDADKAVAIGESIKLTPTDGLGISNSDLDQIGAKSYNDVDRVLQTLVCPASPENDRVQDALTVEIGPEIIDKIIKRRSNSRFKREKSPIYISRERYE